MQYTYILDTAISIPYTYPMPPTRATLPIQESPVKALRGDVLQERFAKRVGISRIALLRFEQGTIPEPSTKLIPYLPQGLPWEAFVEDYHQYQIAKREANYGILDPDFEFTSSCHPFDEWLGASNADNLTQVCVALCLHLPIMYRWVNGPHPALPPDLLLDALDNAGYSKKLISDLVLSYAEWKSRHGLGVA